MCVGTNEISEIIGLIFSVSGDPILSQEMHLCNKKMFTFLFMENLISEYTIIHGIFSSQNYKLFYRHVSLFTYLCNDDVIPLYFSYESLESFHCHIQRSKWNRS